MTALLPEQFRNLPADQVEEALCRAHPGVWAERRRGFVNAAFHWEWYDLILTEKRSATVAPRDHAKTEVFTINQTAWRSIYFPGTWTYVFTAVKDQAEQLKERIDAAIEEVEPQLVHRARTNTKKSTVYSNWSRVTVAGAGQAVRSAHPDVIIGDDVLEEARCRTALMRRRTKDWWSGTVGGMAHSGTMRRIGGGQKVWMPPTRIYLIGTPFHADDLLLAMKKNPLYRFRRYAAEFDPAELKDGLALEVA